MEEQEVKTMSQARDKAEYIIKAIEEGNSKESSLKSQCSSMLFQLIKSDSDDSKLREQAIDTAKFFNSTYEELINLKSSYARSDNGSDFYKWTKIKKDINLLEYVPDNITELKDEKGNVYPGIIEDVEPCFALFKKWIKPQKNNNRKMIDFGETDEDRDDVLSGRDSDREKEKSWEYSKRGMFLAHGNNDFYYYEWNTKENRDRIVNLREEKKNLHNLRVGFDELKKYVEDEAKNYAKYCEYIKNNSSVITYKDEEGVTHSETNWTYLRYLSLKHEYEYERDRYNQRVIDIANKKALIENIENSVKPSKMVGSYYDDDYLIQREIRKIHTEKIRMVIDTHSYRGKWGKVHTENVYDHIVKEVEDFKRQTSQNPLFPNVDFDMFYNNDNNNSCLFNTLSAIKNISLAKEGTGTTPTFFNQIKVSHNNFFDGKDKKMFTIYVEGENGKNMLLDINNMSLQIPDYLYYENNTKDRFMLVKVVNKEFIPLGETVLKKEYERRYNESIKDVKDFVYDDDYLLSFYKDIKYKIKLTLDLDFSNLYEEEYENRYIPIVRVGDKAYIDLCKHYKDRISKNLEDCFGFYDITPLSLRCEDGEPYIEYAKFIKYVKNLVISNNDNANIFVKYCIDVISTWANDRIKNLENVLNDIGIRKKFLNIMSLRLRKNSGTLPIWYQSLINFDDSYINNMISREVLEENASSMFVTTGYDYDNSHKDKSKNVILFNSQRNPSFIDIEDLDENVYKGGAFKKGKVYIFKEISQHENKIERIEKIEIERFDNKKVIDNPKGTETNDSDSLNDMVSVKKVTRLILSHPLPSWCQTNDPKSIIVCQMRT